MLVDHIGIDEADGAERLGAAPVGVAATAHPVPGEPTASSPGRHAMPGEPRARLGTVLPATLDLRDCAEGRHHSRSLRWTVLRTPQVPWAGPWRYQAISHLQPRARHSSDRCRRCSCAGGGSGPAGARCLHGRRSRRDVRRRLLPMHVRFPLGHRGQGRSGPAWLTAAPHPQLRPDGRRRRPCHP